MASPIIPIIFSLIVGVAHYFSNRFNLRHKMYHARFLSLAAGVSITYVLLELLPNFTGLVNQVGRIYYVTLLLGFIIHHLIEKEIYKHNHRKQLMKVLSIEENVFSFFYHIVLGMLLVIFLSDNIVQGLLFFVPILTFTFAKELPALPHKYHSQRLMIASSTFLGVLLAIGLGQIPVGITTTLMGLTSGILLYTIVRHHIPFGRSGRIGYFTIGFFVYAALIIASWYV